MKVTAKIGSPEEIADFLRDASTHERKPAPARDCLNCQGTGQRSWPQSRRNPRNPLEVIERLPPQITKCGACNGSGVIRP